MSSDHIVRWSLCFLMIRRPPRSTRTDTLCPYTTLFRSMFCRELEGALGHAVQANAYLTPPGAAGLTPHHDTHDVFVLQVHGTKHWIIREPLVEAPLDRHRSDHELAAEQPVLFEADMAPGDCLYLPRGFIHSAAAQEGVSLHLTIGVLRSEEHTSEL